MQADDFDSALAAARRQLDEALAAAGPAPAAGGVHVHGGTAVNVGNNVHIGTQTIHFTIVTIVHQTINVGGRPERIQTSPPTARQRRTARPGRHSKE